MTEVESLANSQMGELSKRLSAVFLKNMLASTPYSVQRIASCLNKPATLT